jgi:hypothetical protein
MLNDEPERRGQGVEEEAKAGLGGSWLWPACGAAGMQKRGDLSR